MNVRAILIVSASAFLVACNGGGGDGNNDPSALGPSSPITLVDGEVKSIAVDGNPYKAFSDIVDYPNKCDPQNNGSMGFLDTYADIDTYFESENFRVYSDVDNVEQMRLVASIAEESLDAIAGKLGMSDTELLDLRTGYSHINITDSLGIISYISGLAESYGEELFNQIPFIDRLGIPYADFVDSLDVPPSHGRDHLIRYINTLNEEEASILVAELPRLIDIYEGHQEIQQKRIVPRKIQICVLEERNNIGSANAQGISVKSPSTLENHLKANNYQGYRRIFQHEMVHMAEFIITATYWGDISTPWWFAEGVAEYLTDGHLSSNPTFLNPVYSAYTPNENAFNAVGWDSGKLYAIFTSAVDFLFSGDAPKLNNGGVNGILSIWLDIRESSRRNGTRETEVYTTSRHPESVGTRHYTINRKPIFEEVFSNTMKKRDGSALTFDEFGEEYESLLGGR